MLGSDDSWSSGSLWSRAHSTRCARMRSCLATSDVTRPAVEGGWDACEATCLRSDGVQDSVQHVVGIRSQGLTPPTRLGRDTTLSGGLTAAAHASPPLAAWQAHMARAPLRAPAHT